MSSNLDTIQDLRTQLTPPVKRGTLIKVVSLGGNISPALKGLAFFALSGMRQTELDNIGILVNEALGYVAAKDLKGLEQFFIDCKIPPQFMELFKLYASNLVKE